MGGEFVRRTRDRDATPAARTVEEVDLRRVQRGSSSTGGRDRAARRPPDSFAGFGAAPLSAPSTSPSRIQRAASIITSPESASAAVPARIQRAPADHHSPALLTTRPLGRTHHAAPARHDPAAATIRRKGGVKQLSSKSVSSKLQQLPIIQQQLSTQLAQGPTGSEHVERALKLFDEHLARKSAPGAYVNEAVRIATVLDATAAELARSINDPTLKGRIATELIAAYRTELTEALRAARGAKPTDTASAQQSAKALDLAGAIVSDDPLLHFVTGKASAEGAAWRIREMAVSGNVFPHEMFRILKDRLQMEFASFTHDEAQKGRKGNDTITETDKKTGNTKTGESGFKLNELIGEIDPSFHWQVTGATSDAKTKSKLPAWDGDSTKMWKDLTAKLTLLETLVSDVALKSQQLTPKQLADEQAKSGTALSAKQSEHFARLREGETGELADYESKGKSALDTVIDDFMKRYAMTDKGKASQLVADVLTGLTKVPLTLTSDVDRLFAERDDKAALPKYGSVYKSEPALMQHEVDLGATIGKPGHDAKAMAIGKPDPNFTKSRGENYMRWRRDKDERETGYHELGADDLPVFGAVNPNFDATKGGNANWADVDTATKTYSNSYGVNYYGDMHMVLKDSVRPRSTFIARGKQTTEGRRIERTDLTLLLADMIRMKMLDYVDALVAGAVGSDKTVLTNMDAEVHIYGTFDAAKDVAEIYLPTAAFNDTTGAGQRCKDFAHANGIKVFDIGAAPTGFVTYAQGGVDMKALVKAKRG